jgi:hypothetical protein
MRPDRSWTSLTVGESMTAVRLRFLEKRTPKMS